MRSALGWSERPPRPLLVPRERRRRPLPLRCLRPRAGPLLRARKRALSRRPRAEVVATLPCRAGSQTALEGLLEDFTVFLRSCRLKNPLAGWISMKQLIPPSSGSVAGTTYSRNRYGQYIRTRATPVNPNSVAQALVRSRFTTVAQGWRNLTAGARQAWQQYADTHPLIDSLGQAKVLSGSAQYQSTNLLRLAAGLSISSVVPTPPTGSLNAFAIVLTLDDTGPTRVYTVAGNDQATGYKAIIYASGPQSVGNPYPKRMAQIAVVDATTWSTPVSVSSGFSTVYGNFFQDQLVVTRARIVSDTGAELATSQVPSLVVDTTP